MDAIINFLKQTGFYMLGAGFMDMGWKYLLKWFPPPLYYGCIRNGGEFTWKGV